MLADTRMRQREANEFLQQLADPFENRPPQSVQTLLRENRRRVREYDLSTRSVRIVIT